MKQIKILKGLGAFFDICTYFMIGFVWGLNYMAAYTGVSISYFTVYMSVGIFALFAISALITKLLIIKKENN